MESGWVGFTDRVKSRTTVQQCASPALYFLLLSATEARRPSGFSVLHKQEGLTRRWRNINFAGPNCPNTPH